MTKGKRAQSRKQKSCCREAGASLKQLPQLPQAEHQKLYWLTALAWCTDAPLIPPTPLRTLTLETLLASSPRHRRVSFSV